MILLERYAYCPTHTEGVLSIGEWDCYTLERPWENNRPGRSCIPEGTYKAKIGRYNAGGYRCIELLEVPGRTEIKIHGANRVDQLRGCIAPGLRWGAMQNQRAVLQSRATLEELLERLKAFEFEIRVSFRNRYADPS